jgi:hypothetical protein
MAVFTLKPVEVRMRYFLLVAALVCSTPLARAEFHPDAHRVHEEHWRGHPEQPDHLVEFWHQRFFHRAPAGTWLGHWVEELHRGIAPELAVAEILASPEYYAQCGGKVEGFVRAVFLEVVGRAPTRTEYDFWLRRFYHEDRTQVAHDLILRYPPAWVIGEPAPAPTYEYRAPVVRYHR